LRVGSCDGPRNFILVHGTWRTTTSLSAALDTVCKFVDRNHQEVVILDFHRFVELECPINWKELHGMILDTLGARLYRYPEYLPNLKQIWKTSGRIIVAWNSSIGIHPNFFPGIEQGWYPDVATINDLHAAIEEHLKDADHKVDLWTVGAVIPAAPFRRVAHIPDLRHWFFPGQAWTRRVNIIQADFVIEINLVPNAVAQCVLNAIEHPPQQESFPDDH
jgi:hypothetical protein